MYNKILVPLDGSKLSEEVLPLVRELAKLSRCEVILLRIAEYPHSLYPPCYQYPSPDPEVARTILERKQAIAHQAAAYLDHIAPTLRSAGIKVIIEICDGPVVESILSCADRLGADLAVISAYGQSGNTKGTVGATASRLLRESPIPVILVRPSSFSSVHRRYDTSDGLRSMAVA